MPLVGISCPRVEKVSQKFLAQGAKFRGISRFFSRGAARRISILKRIVSWGVDSRRGSAGVMVLQRGRKRGVYLCYHHEVIPIYNCIRSAKVTNAKSCVKAAPYPPLSTSRSKGIGHPGPHQAPRGATVGRRSAAARTRSRVAPPRSATRICRRGPASRGHNS